MTRSAKASAGFVIEARPGAEKELGSSRLLDWYS
jgi:hypothetical protein